MLSLTSSAIQSRLAGNFDEAANAAKKRKIQRLDQDSEYVAAMVACLSKVARTCLFCHVLGGKPSILHRHFMECPIFVGEIREQFKELRRSIKYGKGFEPICWHCHVPLCRDLLHGNPPVKGQPEQCQYRDIILPVAFGIFYSKDLYANAMTALHGPTPADTTVQGFAAWLSEKPSANHKSKPTELFIWYIDTHV